MLNTPRLQIRFIFFKAERIIRVVKSVFDTSQCRISSRNQIKNSHFGEVSNLLCETPSSGKSSITDQNSQAVMVQQQGLQIWVWSSIQASHSCLELIWQTQTSGACGFSVGTEVNSLPPCMAAQKLLCHFLCVFEYRIEQKPGFGAGLSAGADVLHCMSKLCLIPCSSMCTSQIMVKA